MDLRARHAGFTAAAVLALAGCGGGDGSTVADSAPSGDRLTPTQQRGAEVLDRTGCLACHALNGTGSNSSAADLTRIGARRTPAQIRETLLDPPLPMPPYTSLAKSDLEVLVAYLSSLR